MNEQHTRAVLPIAEDVLSVRRDHMRCQVSWVIRCAASASPLSNVVSVQLLRSDLSSSEEEHFRIMLTLTEVELVKFFVRSYLSCARLFKVNKVCYHATSANQPLAIQGCTELCRPTDPKERFPVMQSSTELYISV